MYSPRDEGWSRWDVVEEETEGGRGTRRGGRRGGLGR